MKEFVSKVKAKKRSDRIDDILGNTYSTFSTDIKIDDRVNITDMEMKDGVMNVTMNVIPDKTLQYMEIPIMISSRDCR